MRFMMFKIYLMTALIISLTISTTFGNPVENDSVKYYFKPVVITGQRYKMPQQDVAASVSIIEQATLRRTNIETVMDAISYMTPGAFTTRRSNLGYGVSTLAAGGITIRGIGGAPNSQVLVLIDGRPDFQGIFSHPISDAYPLDHVDHIEVLRGPASVVYGTNALGGVINIITRDMEGIDRSSYIKVQYGSYNTQKYMIQNSGHLGELTYSLSMAHQQSDGHREKSQFKGQHYALKFDYKINTQFNLMMTGSLTPYRFHDPGPEDIELRGFFDHGAIMRSSADISLSNEYTNTDGIIKIHGNFGRHDLSDGWFSEDQTNGILTYQNFQFAHDIKTTIGFDVKRFGGGSKSNNTSLGTFFNDEIATYVHIQKDFQKLFILDTGIRFEHNSNFGWEEIPRIGIVYHANANTSFRTAVTKGFRSPSVRELFLFNPANAKLKPEKLINYEFGFHSTLAKGYDIDMSTFYYQGNQLIEMNILGPGIALNENSGENSTRGFEIALDAKPLDNLHTQLSYSYIESNIILPFAPNKFNYWINYSFRSVNVTMFGEIIDQLFCSYQLNQLPPTTTKERMPDYGLMHINVQYLINRMVKIGLSLENITDKHYSIMKGYPMPGRNFNAYISLDF